MEKHMDYQWDLSQIYGNLAELEADEQNLKNIGKQICKCKGTLATRDGLLKYLQLSEKFSFIKDKVTSYLFFLKSLDGSNVFAINKLAQLENYMEKFSVDTTFVSQELKKIDDKHLDDWASEEQFERFDRTLMHIKKAKKHTISASKEKLVIGAAFSASQDELFDCLDNVEIKYGTTKDENGKTVTLTNANLHILATSCNKNVRKSAICKVFKAYKALNQTLSVNYISHLKFGNFIAKTYKYKNTLKKCLDEDELPNNLPQKVVSLTNKFLPLLYSYYAWRKDFMNLETFESCDLSCKLFDQKITDKFELDEAIKIIKLATSSIGSDYGKIIDKATKEGWIDSKAAPNKDSGAYSAALYGIHPFVLLTYDKSAQSVSTLAHELGHAINAYYTHKSMPYIKSDNPIFVAEVASTVNEILLAEYHIEHSKNDREKIANITDFLNTFCATAFTQTEYTEFELFVHECVDKSVALNYKKLNDYYLKLQKKYCGDGVKVLPLSQYHWSRIPHFYSDFYVFKYVTGWVAACAIAHKLKTQEGYNKKYIEFLSAGDKAEPCKLLEIVDIDILNKDTFDSAFALFEKYLQELKSLTAGKTLENF